MKNIVAGVMLGSLVVLTGCSEYMHHDGKMGMHHHMNMKLNDGQIVSVLHTANMGEVTQGQIALQKVRSSAVRSFAQQMVADHSSNDQQGQGWAQQAGVTPQANHLSMKLQKDSDEVVSKLNAASGSDFDKTYMDSQVKVHKMVLKIIDDKLLPSAQSSDLRNFLMQTRTAVAGHLQMAQQIQSAL